MKSRYVICSITSSGLAMPPDQKALQTLSTWLLSSPGTNGDSSCGGGHAFFECGRPNARAAPPPVFSCPRSPSVALGEG